MTRGKNGKGKKRFPIKTKIMKCEEQERERKKWSWGWRIGECSRLTLRLGTKDTFSDQFNFKMIRVQLDDGKEEHQEDRNLNSSRWPRLMRHARKLDLMINNLKSQSSASKAGFPSVVSLSRSGFCSSSFPSPPLSSPKSITSAVASWSFCLASNTRILKEEEPDPFTLFATKAWFRAQKIRHWRVQSEKLGHRFRLAKNSFRQRNSRPLWQLWKVWKSSSNLAMGGLDGRECRAHCRSALSPVKWVWESPPQTPPGSYPKVSDHLGLIVWNDSSPSRRTPKRIFLNLLAGTIINAEEVLHVASIRSKSDLSCIPRTWSLKEDLW